MRGPAATGSPHAPPGPNIPGMELTAPLPDGTSSPLFRVVTPEPTGAPGAGGMPPAPAAALPACRREAAAAAGRTRPGARGAA